MNWAVITGRWGPPGVMAGRPAGTLSRWAWTADSILAFVLAAATSIATWQSDGRYDVPLGVPLRAEVASGSPWERIPPLPPVPPVPPDPLDPLEPVIRPVPGVVLEHLEPLHTWQPVLAVLTALPLLARRWRPLTAYWAVIVLTLLFHLAVEAQETTAFTFVSCLIAGYSAAMYSPHRAGAVASVLIGAGLLAAAHDTNIPQIAPAYLPFLLLIPIGLAANAIHTQTQRIRFLESEQAAASRLAVDQERSRIARELHDVVTHNVSVMVIQAGAARKVLDVAPDQARRALLAVEAGGRAAMAELRHVMGLLTMAGNGPDPAVTADLAPQPGLDQVAALAGRVRDTGVPVELTTTGTPTALPAGVDLAAFRVVQEALTNAVKHAAGARVRIGIEYAADEVRIEVTDNGGTPTASAASGNGAGLIGLRERLGVYGGALQAGPRPTGGYRVQAIIPLEAP